MNKLRQTLMNKKPWGHEVIWTLTDSYMAKTIELAPGKQTPLVVHENKEKSIIVIKGPVLLVYGSCCDESSVPMYKLPEGWSWYIDTGMIHRYASIGTSALLIEVSSPLLEDGIILADESNIEIDLNVKDVSKR